jgi:hypothetical protein
MATQVFDDGAYFEQSSYYHVYATDMFLFFAILAHPGPEYLQRLERMADFLDHLMGPSRVLPLLGDDDGGRLFYPFGVRTEFGRGTLAACGAFLRQPRWIAAREDLHSLAAWWLGETVLAVEPVPDKAFVSRLFPNTGIATLVQGDCQVVFDVGGFGPGSAGHSHADALSLIVRRGAEEILIDPGTFTYAGDLMWRNRFRGSAFHNTVSIDELQQAEFGNAFSWRGRPSVELISFAPAEVRAVCGYSDFRHQRAVKLENDGRLTVVDEISGPPGKHVVSWFWHFGIPFARAQRMIAFGPGLDVAWEQGGQHGWRSPALGVREPDLVVMAQIETELPVRRETTFRLE